VLVLQRVRRAFVVFSGVVGTTFAATSEGPISGVAPNGGYVGLTTENPPFVQNVVSVFRTGKSTVRAHTCAFSVGGAPTLP